MKQKKLMACIILLAIIFLLVSCHLREKTDIYNASINTISECRDIGPILSERIYLYVKENDIHQVSELEHKDSRGVCGIGKKRVQYLEDKFN